MEHKSYRIGLFLSVLMSVWVISFCSCQHDKTNVAHSKLLLDQAAKVVVIGFQPAISPGKKPDIVRDPLSGSVFLAEPVSWDAVKTMTNTLFETLVAEKRFSLVSPGQARGAFLSIVGSDRLASLDTAKVLQEVGRSFDADAVVVGYLYRWNERDGSDYGVNSPASVAFDLHLMRSIDGVVIWRARFDKTQRSLSENLLDLKTFLSGGGRWMTVRELAFLGLRDLLAEMPADLREREDLKNAGDSSY